jgi:hypothetical protein
VTATAIGTMLPYSDFTTTRRILRTKDTMPNDSLEPRCRASQGTFSPRAAKCTLIRLQGYLEARLQGFKESSSDFPATDSRAQGHE